MEIQIEIENADVHYIDEIMLAERKSVFICSGKKFIGGVDLISAIVTLTAVTIPVLGKIIIEIIKSKKYVKLKIKGIEITGITEKNVLEILEKYAKQQYRGNG